MAESFNEPYLIFLYSQEFCPLENKQLQRARGLQVISVITSTDPKIRRLAGQSSNCGPILVKCVPTPIWFHWIKSQCKRFCVRVDVASTQVLHLPISFCHTLAHPWIHTFVPSPRDFFPPSNLQVGSLTSFGSLPKFLFHRQIFSEYSI